MSYVLGKPLRARLEAGARGKKVFAYACGKSVCDTNANRERMFVPPHLEIFPIIPKAFQARLVGTKNGKKLFAFASECRPQPPEFPTVRFVLKDEWPPHGVTDVLRFKFVSLSNYPLTVSCLGGTDGCPYAYLSWGGGRTWTGSFPTAGGGVTLSLTLLDVQNPDHPLADGWPAEREWQLTVGGCVSPAVVVQAHATCKYPLTLGGQGFTLNTTCCPLAAAGLPPDMGFAVEGFHGRAQPARLIDRTSTPRRNLFFTGVCCEKDSRCEVTACCGCDVSPYQWTFPIAGVANGPGPPPPPGTICPSINGTQLLTFASNSLGDCQWTESVVGVGRWVLQCNQALGKYFLSFDGSGGAGGAVQYQADVASWNCLGANVMTLVAPTNLSCVGWPATVTVNPV